MCFNKETSITVYLFGLVCSIYLMYRGVTKKINIDIYASILLFFIAKMQLIEYFLWKNQKCNFNNKLASSFIIPLLYIQILVIYLMYLYFNKLTPFINNKTKTISFLIIIFTIVTIYMIYILTQNFDKICSLKDTPSCRLIWKPFEFLYNHNYIILLFILLYFLVGIPCIPDQKTFFRNYIFRITIILAIIYAIFYKGIHFVILFSGVWCFLCGLYGPVCILNI